MARERFQGPQMTDLLQQVRATLGDDAVILGLTRPDGRSYCLDAADPVTAASLRTPRREPEPAAHPASGPRVVALVGPTGAGKTTTIAKLANHPEAFGGRRVGLLCLDTYRVGAVEQSRIYAELSRLPLEVAYTPREIPAVLRRLGDRDIILVDTAGRGPRRSDDAATTVACLHALAPSETHLVLPAGLDPVWIRRIIADACDYAPTHLLVTKLDEFPDLAAVERIAANVDLAMTWCTDGQEVPADLHRVAAWMDGRRGTGATFASLLEVA